MEEYLFNRVATANEAQLVAILYEGLISTLQEAGQSIENQNIENLSSQLNRGRDILSELLATLQGESAIAGQLRSLYLYVNQLMTEAQSKQQAERIFEAIRVLTPLHEAWNQLGENKEVNAAQHQKPAVVTGLTYGKGELKDHFMDQGEKWKKG